MSTSLIKYGGNGQKSIKELKSELITVQSRLAMRVSRIKNLEEENRSCREKLRSTKEFSIIKGNNLEIKQAKDDLQRLIGGYNMLIELLKKFNAAPDTSKVDKMLEDESKAKYLETVLEN